MLIERCSDKQGIEVYRQGFLGFREFPLIFQLFLTEICLLCTYIIAGKEREGGGYFASIRVMDLMKGIKEEIK